jgi:hypothetical protein
MNSGTIGDVVIDRHRKRVWLLKYHADSLAKFHDIDIFSINVDIIIENLALNPNFGHKIVHPIQAANKCGLAAAGWTDESCNSFLRNFQGDVL